jgi:IS1 family transposase
MPRKLGGSRKSPVWTWTAICADTKLLANFCIGDRTYRTARSFMEDLKQRLTNRVQLTSDGHRGYIVAVRDAFGDKIDYALLQKLYGADPAGGTRYSPAKCIGARRRAMTGDPYPEHISRSYAKRANLTMRMHMRRFTRLTKCVLKEDRKSRLLGRAGHDVLQLCPHPLDAESYAAAAGVTDRLWEMKELVEMLEAFEAR